MGDLGSIPGPIRSPGEGNGNPLQYSCLGNPMDRGARQTIVHGVAKSQTPLSDFTFLSFFLNKSMKDLQGTKPVFNVEREKFTFVKFFSNRFIMLNPYLCRIDIMEPILQTSKLPF